jgi:hypothetical protein
MKKRTGFMPEARGRIRRMGTPSLSPKATTPLKRVAFISFFSGLGIALAATLVLISFVWYKSQPTPPKPWNASALTITGPPSLNVSKDGKSIELGYSVKNNTRVDFNLDTDAASKLRLLCESRAGALSPPFENNGLKLVYTPIFIPAGQTGALSLSIELSDIPTPKDREVKADYDERLRKYLESTEDVAGLAVYDQVNRYQINLPTAGKKLTN